jgi:hypothetical protein
VQIPGSNQQGRLHVGTGTATFYPHVRSDEVRTKLAEAIKNSGSISGLARRMGFKSSSSLSRVLRGQGMPSARMLRYLGYGRDRSGTITPRQGIALGKVEVTCG